MAGSILVIDDESGIRSLCADVLGRVGYQVHTAGTAAEGLNKLAQHGPALVLCDINLPDLDGVSLLPKLLAHTPPPTVILITAFPSIDTAVRGMKLGARDYVGKPFSPDELRMVVARAFAEDELRHAHHALKQTLAYGTMLGDSPAMQRVRDLIDRAAHSQAPVIISGESGTGKELVARALHYAGPRASHPLVPVNCGALVGNLLDSELFGHVRGAFTGADTAKRGLFVMADHGSLLLDEIGELPLELQPKLLRALQHGEVKPVGSTQAATVDVRVIAATHRDLRQAIANGSFREDLYYRLAVISIDVPPLRDRRADIPALARHFADQAAQRAERERVELSDAAITKLMELPWPGNVRELENAIERAVIMATGSLLDADAFARPIPRATSAPSSTSVELRPLDDVERDHILGVLAACDNQKSKAAKVLGINRTTLWKKLRLYGLDTESEDLDSTPPALT